MGFFGFLAHRSSKSYIKKNTVLYEQQTPDQRAGAIFYIWLLRGLNLTKLRGNSGANIPIYYYLKGAESALSDVIDAFKDNNKNLFSAAHHHFYTNLAVSYPDEGYGSLVRNMWRAVFSNHTDMHEVISEMQGVLNAPQFQDIIKNNDISADELVQDPKLITPHFMIPGHELSVRLMENEKLAKNIMGM